MSITVASLAFLNDTIDRGSPFEYTIPSHTRPAGQLNWCCVAHHRSGAVPSAPTISGFTQVSTVLFNRVATTTVSRLTLFRQLLGSPATSSLTVHMGEQQQNCVASVFTTPGTAVDGTNGSGAVVGSPVSDALDQVQSVPLVLPGFGSPTNGALYVIAKDTTSVYAALSGWTIVHEINNASPGLRMLVAFKSTEDTTVEATWSPSGNADAAAIAIEVKEFVVVAGGDELLLGRIAISVP